MKKIYFVIAGVFFFCMMFTTSFATEVSGKLTINSFLGTAEKDYRLQNHREIVDYLEGAPSSTPYVDKIEFRTETDEFDVSKQKYALRFYPKGWGETEYTDKLAETAKRSNQIEHEAYFNTALKQRYNLVLAYCEAASLLKLKKSLLNVYDDRIQVLRRQSQQNLDFHIDLLIEAEDQYINLELDLVKLENSMSSIVENIKIASDSDTIIDFHEKQMAGIEIVEWVISDMEKNSTPENINLLDQKLKIELSKNKYQLEKSKNKDYLSFLQVSHDTDESDNVEKAYSVRLGFKLPFINPDRDEVNRRKITYMKEKLKYEDEKREASEKIISLTRSLQRLIHQYHILADRKENGNSKISFKTYRNMEGMNPLNLLKIKESMIAGDIQLNNINYQILSRYIELIDVKGKLSRKPLKNYLSKTMEMVG